MTIFFSLFEHAQRYLTPAEFSLENLALNVLEADGGRPALAAVLYCSEL